ncbi:hypothetical protein [Streptomyces sp. NPDC048202]|uniref:hypothetical protein n=1 Tax=unclassified Streptomyces TaxID=2593676 RepID=UPI0037227B6B
MSIGDFAITRRHEVIHEVFVDIALDARWASESVAADGNSRGRPSDVGDARRGDVATGHHADDAGMKETCT